MSRNEETAAVPAQPRKYSRTAAHSSRDLEAMRALGIMHKEKPCICLMRAALVAAAVLFAGVASARTTWDMLNASYTFDAYCAEFGRSYGPAEYASRKALFDTRLSGILAHNANPGRTWKVRRRFPVYMCRFRYRVRVAWRGGDRNPGERPAVSLL